MRLCAKIRLFPHTYALPWLQGDRAHCTQIIISMILVLNRHERLSFYSAVTTSPPCDVPKACQVSHSISSLANLTEPSTMAALTPPGCLLRAASAGVWLENLDGMHGAVSVGTQQYSLSGVMSGVGELGFSQVLNQQKAA